MERSEIDRVLAALENSEHSENDDRSEFSINWSDVDPGEEMADDLSRDTDTDQSEDLDSDGSSTSEDDIPLANRGVYIGEDKVTKWKVAEPTQSIRTRRRNIVLHLPGTKGQAKNAKSPIEAWQCFFTHEILQKIVDYTNLYINDIKDNFSRERDAKPTTLEELNALLGLLYYAGVLKSSHLHTEELWATDGTGVQIFQCVMSQQRFNFLIRALRFDNRTDRAERMAQDKLAPFREIFDYVVKKCTENFSPGECVTIDEMLWKFRGRCGFRQYMRNKPAKYGLKVFSLVDARAFYVVNMEMYLGRQPDGPYQEPQKPDDVVGRIVRPISGSGRNVTHDNWFTNVPLAKKLLDDHNLTTVGTVRKNKAAIPHSFKVTKGREVNSSMFGFGKNNTTLVSYVPKKGKVVLLLSNMHNSKKIDESTGEARKPEIITFYNSTKGGVDVVDELCATYSVARKTRRWPLAAFYHVLNVVGVNSLVICAWNNKEERTVRRKWLKELAKELVAPFMKSRLQIVNLPKVIRTNIQNILKEEDGEEGPAQEDIEDGPRKRKRCGLCDRTGNKSYQKCASCKMHVCGKHAKLTCLKCLDKD